MSRKIFLVACEASGDAHGAHLVAELKKINPALECRGLGGPKMAGEGVRLLHDMTKISALGLSDVLRQYFSYRKIFYGVLREVKNFRPEAVILIDSPAFNLRLAKKLKPLGIPALYYIAPQIWAWGARRIHTIKKTIKKMLVILPFETEIYKGAGVDCEFVGHPLLDQVKTSLPREELRLEFGITRNQTAVGLMPGSRASEVKRILPIMLESAHKLSGLKKEITFFLSESTNVGANLYDKILARYPAIKVQRYSDRIYDHVAAMDFALVASGTATLETALLGTPFFLLYKASASTYFLGKRLVRVPYLGLVNLLAGKAVVPEFIQNEAVPQRIAHEAKVLLENPEACEKMKAEFRQVKEKLGEKGASRRAAEAVMRTLAVSRLEVR